MRLFPLQEMSTAECNFLRSPAAGTGLTAIVNPRCRLRRALIEIHLRHPSYCGTSVGPHHNLIVSSKVPVPRRPSRQRLSLYPLRLEPQARLK